MSEQTMHETVEDSRLRTFLRTSCFLVCCYGLAWFFWHFLIRPHHPGIQILSSTNPEELSSGEKILMKATLGGGLMVFLGIYGGLLRKFGGQLQREAGLAGLFIFFHFLACLSYVPFLCRALDGQPATTYRLPVVDRSDGNAGFDGTGYSVIVPSWRSGGDERVGIDISRRDYNAIVAGKAVLYVTTGPGYKGTAWAFGETEAEFLRHPTKDVRDLVPAGN